MIKSFALINVYLAARKTQRFTYLSEKAFQQWEISQYV